jgi:hypothetical protein
MLLTDLENDVLLLVLKLLDTCSLAGLACTCRRLNALVALDELWEPFCRARWRHLHAAFYERRTNACSSTVSPAAQRSCASSSSAGGTDWKALYDAGNGWHNPSFMLRHIPLDADFDFVSAIARAGQGQPLTIATSHRIEQWDPGSHGCMLIRVDSISMMQSRFGLRRRRCPPDRRLQVVPLRRRARWPQWPCMTTT